MKIKKKYNEIKKNQEKSDIITNKIANKIVNLFKSKSLDDTSKNHKIKNLKIYQERIKIKNQKVLLKRKKEKKERIKD